MEFPNGAKVTLSRIGKLAVFQLLFFFLVVMILIGMEFFSIELPNWVDLIGAGVLILVWVAVVHLMQNEFFIEDFERRNKK